MHIICQHVFTLNKIEPCLDQSKNASELKMEIHCFFKMKLCLKPKFKKWIWNIYHLNHSKQSPVGRRGGEEVAKQTKKNLPFLEFLSHHLEVVLPVRVRFTDQLIEQQQHSGTLICVLAIILCGSNTCFGSNICLIITGPKLVPVTRVNMPASISDEDGSAPLAKKTPTFELREVLTPRLCQGKYLSVQKTVSCISWPSMVSKSVCACT